MTSADPYRLSSHVEDVLNRAQRWSRTVATGVIDTSTSAEKTAALAAIEPITGAPTAQALQGEVAGFRRAIRAGCALLEHASPSDLTPALLTELNQAVAGSGLGGHERRHEKPEFEYLPSKQITADMAAFCERVATHSASQADNAAVADLLFDVHWSVDLRGHYFMDGCGRTALILGSWLTVALQGRLWTLPTRADYLQMALHPQPKDEWRRLLAGNDS